MMPCLPRHSRQAILVAVRWPLIASPARADGRAELVTCQAMVDRVGNRRRRARLPPGRTMRRCRVAGKSSSDWTLRELRMSVDEQGRPLR